MRLISVALLIAVLAVCHRTACVFFLALALSTIRKFYFTPFFLLSFDSIALAPGINK